AFELYPPTVTFAQFVKEGAAHALSATVRHAHSQSFVTIENERTVPLVGIAMQIGNDHHGELETLRLMDRHQPHNVGSFIHLPFAFAPADGFKLFNVVNKVANQKSRLLKLFG